MFNVELQDSSLVMKSQGLIIVIIVIYLNLLPLMYYYELSDIIFLVNALKNKNERFNVLQFVKIQDLNTRSSDRITLKQVRCESNLQEHFFNRITKLWNKMPEIGSIATAKTIRTKLYKVIIIIIIMKASRVLMPRWRCQSYIT